MQGHRSQPDAGVPEHPGTPGNSATAAPVFPGDPSATTVFRPEWSQVVAPVQLGIVDEFGAVIAAQAAAWAGHPWLRRTHRSWKPATSRQLSIAERADRQRFERERRSASGRPA